MNVYLFSYDLHPAFPRSTDALIGEIKQFESWAQCLEKSWLIATHEDQMEPIVRRLRGHLRDTDTILLIPINLSGLMANFPQPIMNWIQQMQAQP